MTKTILSIALALAVAACGGKDDHTIVGGVGNAEAEAAASAAAANIQLPPAILASKSYRCKDNSVLSIDWLDNGAARVRLGKDDVGTEVAAGAPTLSGDSKAATITYNGKSCKA